MTESNLGERVRIILYMVIIPLVFTVIIGGILGQIFGVFNLASWGRELPLVGGFFPEAEEVVEEQVDSEKEDSLEKLEQELEELEAELQAERAELESYEQELEDLEQKLEEREEELAAWEQDLEGQEVGIEDREQRLSETAAMYEEMRPQDAADIMANLEDNLVIEILERLPEGQRARILTEMDSARASEITRIITAD